jgi:TolA-binding protein
MERVSAGHKERVARRTGKSHLGRGAQTATTAGQKPPMLLRTIGIGIGLLLLVVGIISYASRGDLSEQQYHAAAVFHNNEEYRKAADAYTNFLKRYPNDVKAPDALYSLAACLEMAGENVNALRAYETFLKKHPDSGWTVYVQYWKGGIHLKLQQFDAAIKEYKELIRKNPKHIILLSAMRGIGVALQEKDMFEKAIEMYEQALKEEGIATDGYIHYQMALCHLELNHQNEAQQLLEKIISNERANPELINEAKEKIKTIKK